MTTSFVRGITLRDCIVIVDECQNLSGPELDTIMTRVGDNCRIIFSGDFRQTDLLYAREKAGMKKFVEILNRLDEFSIINFTMNDCVRSGIVKKYMIMREDLNIDFSE
jgi:predicted ribonuclease YlaK